MINLYRTRENLIFIIVSFICIVSQSLRNSYNELNWHYQNLDIAKEIKYPAKYEEVIAIGAIKSFWIFNGHEKYSPVGSKIEYVCDGNYGSMKGTSFSAARATAIISKIKADYPDLNGEGFREILMLKILETKGEIIGLGMGNYGISRRDR